MPSLDTSIDFDDIDRWSPWLSNALKDIVPVSIENRLKLAKPAYVEDALALVLEHTSRKEFIAAALAWVRQANVVGYHGTRLTDEEVDSVLKTGLKPLRAEDRLSRLTRALSRHPRWEQISHLLEKEIQSCGPGNKAGHRENQVHLTISRAGLTNSFSHYLTKGSEFDQRVAESVLGDEGADLLQRDGAARILRVIVPGTLALDAANWIFGVDYRIANGEAPNLLNELLKAWSYKLAHANFQASELELDCGMVFKSAIAPEWIVDIETSGI